MGGAYQKEFSCGIEGVTEIDGRAPVHCDVDAEVADCEGVELGLSDECEVDSLTNTEIVDSGRELERASAAGVVEFRSDGGGPLGSRRRRNGSRRWGSAVLNCDRSNHGEDLMRYADQRVCARRVECEREINGFATVDVYIYSQIVDSEAVELRL